MANPALVSLAKAQASQLLLDPALVCAVCEQESFWRPSAVRFEPAFEARYIHPALPQAPTTLELTKAISFGLMQIMGETAIEFGWKGDFLTELCVPEVGLLYGCKKLRRCCDRLSQVSDALLAYNGGGNPNYPAE